MDPIIERVLLKVNQKLYTNVTQRNYLNVNK